jgi:hypothetical protein
VRGGRHRVERERKAAASGEPTVDLPDPFRNQLTVTESGCWRWYGQHREDGRPRLHGDYVYRVLYRRLRGAIPRRRVLHHVICNQRWCANPWHVEPLTQSEHMKAHGFGGDWGQSAKPTCPRGHPYDGSNLVVWKNERHCRTCMREASKRFYRANVTEQRAKARDRQRRKRADSA